MRHCQRSITKSHRQSSSFYIIANLCCHIVQDESLKLLLLTACSPLREEWDTASTRVSLSDFTKYHCKLPAFTPHVLTCMQMIIVGFFCVHIFLFCFKVVGWMAFMSSHICVKLPSPPPQLDDGSETHFYMCFKLNCNAPVGKLLMPI